MPFCFLDILCIDPRFVEVGVFMSSAHVFRVQDVFVTQGWNGSCLLVGSLNMTRIQI